MCNILNTWLVRDRKFEASQPIPTHLFKKCDIWTLKFTSVHGIDIVVMSKWMKCARKSQSLLAASPCSYASNMINVVTIHDFVFNMIMLSFTHCEYFAQ